MPTLLIVDDEPTIADPLARFFEGERFDVRVARDVAAATAAVRDAEGRPAVDLVLLDWSLPDGTGIELLKRWRESGYGGPIVMLTARHELIDKVLGLELGADDYVTKPFEPRELLARVRARLRQGAVRAADAGMPPLRAAGIALDPSTHQVQFRGAAVELTKMEFNLLRLLLENAGKVFTRDELLDRVWGYESYPTTRTVDTHVLQLRQKLAPELIETVRGVGYRLSVTLD